MNKVGEPRAVTVMQLADEREFVSSIYGVGLI